MDERGLIFVLVLEALALGAMAIHLLLGVIAA